MIGNENRNLLTSHAVLGREWPQDDQQDQEEILEAA